MEKNIVTYDLGSTLDGEKHIYQEDLMVDIFIPISKKEPFDTLLAQEDYAFADKDTLTKFMDTKGLKPRDYIVSIYTDEKTNWTFLDENGDVVNIV